MAVLSIAFDPQSEQVLAMREYDLTDVPMLIDSNHSVSEDYGVLRWAVKTGEPGHTFVLVDAEGDVAWIQDYGAPENRGVMYVPVEELTLEVESHLGK